jgi:hypothetical protein
MRFPKFLYALPRYWRRGYHTRRPEVPRPLVLEPFEDRVLLSILFSSSGSRTVQDNGGPVITYPSVDLIFWGTGWSAGSGPALRTSLEHAVDAILQGPYLTGLGQYRHIGPGLRVRSDAITTSNPPSCFTNGQVNGMLLTNLGNHALPNPAIDNQLLYMVIPQPGSGTCSDIGGEHFSDTFNGTHFHFGWTINNGNLDTLTTIFSHELVEAASDAEPNNNVAFYVPSTNDEIGDKEAQNYSYRLPNSDILVQSYLSQQDHAYIVPTGQSQNFIVTNSSSRILGVTGDQLGNHNDTITIDRSSGGGVRVTLNGEVAQFDPGQISFIVVNSGTGNDVINVLRTAVPVAINSAGAATVNVGVGGSVQSILGAVTITNSSSLTTVNVDDSTDVTTRTPTFDTFTPSGDTAYGRITGLAPATITYRYRDTNYVSVQTGPGARTVNVLATGKPLYLSGHGQNTVNVGNLAHTLQDILGSLYLSNTSSTWLNVDDSADSRAVSALVSDGQIIGTMLPSSINYGPNTLSNLDILGGSGNNTFTFNMTTALFQVDLFTGHGFNTENVQRTRRLVDIDNGNNGTVNIGVGGSVQGILGAVVITNSSGLTTVNVDDSNDATARTVTFDSYKLPWDSPYGRITGLAPATIDYNYGDTNEVNVQTGPGGGTLNVQSTGKPLHLSGHGQNTVTVGNSIHGVQDILGSVYLSNSSRTDLTVDDSADSRGQNALISATQITGMLPSSINYATTTLSSLTIDGGSGGNTFNVLSTAAGTTVTINAGTGSDTIIVGNPTLADAGPVTVNGRPGGSTTLIVDDHGTSTSETYTVTATSVSRTSAGGGTISYSNVHNLIVKVGTATEVVNVLGTPANTSVTLNAGGANDLFNIGDAFNTLDGVLGDLTVNGQGGNNKLTLNNQGEGYPNDFSYGIYAGYVQVSHGLRFLSVYYANMPQLLFNGPSSGVDLYEVYGIAAGTQLTLNGGTGTNSLQVRRSRLNNWLITGPNAGSVNGNLRFTGMNYLITDYGGTNVFAFTPGGSVPDIRSNVGNTAKLDFSAYGSGVAVNLATATVPGVVTDGFSGIQTFIGATGSNRLMGPNADTTWTITNPDTVTVGAMVFSGFQNLVGGSGADRFQFSSIGTISGSIDGGGGTNTLDYSAYTGTVLVNLQTGMATGVGGGIANNSIQNVIGGTGPGGYNILVGNGGNYLQDGTGRRNLLTAGASASTLVGGNGDDILIGGTTAYDLEMDLASLQAIMTYWAGTTDDFPTRMANLLSGNGVPLLDASMVVNNGGGNTMLGHGSGSPNQVLYYGLDPSLENTDYDPTRDGWVYI